MYALCAVAIAMLVITSTILIASGAMLVEEKGDTFAGVATAWGVLLFVAGLGMSYGLARIHEGTIPQQNQVRHTAPIENMPTHPPPPPPQPNPPISGPSKPGLMQNTAPLQSNLI